MYGIRYYLLIAKSLHLVHTKHILNAMYQIVKSSERRNSMITSIQKWGNSQGVRIPKAMLKAMQWSENESIIMNIEDDRIVISKFHSRKNIKELFESYQEEYKPINIDWGDPAGEEVW